MSGTARHAWISASLVLSLLAGNALAVTNPSVPRATSTLVTQGPAERIYRVTADRQAALVASPAYQAFLARHGSAWEAQFDEILGTPVWVRGVGIPLIPDYENATKGQVVAISRRFIHESRALLQIDADDLALDSATYYSDVWVVYFHREYQGTPVLRSSVELVYKLGRLILFYGESYPVKGLDTAALLRAEDARQVASGELALPDEPAVKAMPKDRMRLCVYPQIGGEAIAYRLAWEVTQERLDSTPELSFVSYVDARTGKILEIQDRIENQFSGNVKLRVDDRYPGGPFATVDGREQRVSVGGSQTTTDLAGNWTIAGSGTQTLNTSLSGTHTTISNQAGGNMSIGHAVTAGTPSNDLFNATTEFDLAQTDAYRAVNSTNAMVRGVYTNNAWLASTSVTTKVNVNQTCNAYWDGTSLNMFRTGGQCNNTGRILDVVAHEYGHGCDQNLPGGIADGGLSEFIGDQMSFLQTDDHRIGPYFFTNGNPIRDLQPSNFPCYDPSVTEVHDQGEMLGSVVWDIHEALKAAGVTGTPLRNLHIMPIATSQTRSAWYNGMLVADDDDGNLANGTPHGCIIWGQFNSHSCGSTRWPGVPTSQVPCFGGTPPVADFLGNPTSGNAPLTVQFTDQSSGNPTGWSWDFGDGGGATTRNATHTYTAGGTYTVTLTVVSSSGSSTKTKTNYINVGGGSAPPVADFSGNPRSGNSPLSVTFTDLTTNAPTSWSWSFGDGAVSSQRNPSHVYNASGSYTVALTAANAFGNDSMVKNGYIVVGSSGGTEEIITGPGPGALGPQVKTWDRGSPPTVVNSWMAYSVPYYGVNVASVDIVAGGSREILTGPGPGGNYGPVVHGYSAIGLPITKVNFAAYGGNSGGVHVSGGNLDADAHGEILTAPGPVSVFPPQVRGFNFDGGTLTAIQKVNFYAYTGVGWGGRVGAGDLDADGFSEIITGPGPGASYTTNIRSFNYDGNQLTWWHNFFAFYGGGYGAAVTGGNTDTEGSDEIIVAHGPDPYSPASVRGFNAAPLLMEWQLTAFPGIGGAEVAAGNLIAGGSDEVLVGQGWGAANTAGVRGFTINGAIGNLIPGLDFLAYWNYPYGAKVAVGDTGI